MIDMKTKRIIEEFLDEIDAPCTAYERLFTEIIREAVAFSLKGCKGAFTKELGFWSKLI